MALKRRSRPNRIGSRGEAAFAYFATRHGLLQPTKVAEDVGLDFVCQVDEDPTSAEPSRVSPTLLGAAVRSTESSDGRIRLERDDVVGLLRLQVPVCLVLIHSIGGEDHFYHRVLDVDFAERLRIFLESSHATVSLTPADCDGEESFRKNVEQIIAPGAVERRRLALAERHVNRALQGAQVEIRRDAHDDYTFVTTLNFYDYFDQLDEAARERLYAATFGLPGLRQERLAQLALREDVVASLDELPQPYVLGGFTVAEPTVLHVVGPRGGARLNVTYTSNGEHSGYVHESGFALTISRRKRRGAEWIHELAAYADIEARVTTGGDPELIRFLDCCSSDASITFPDRGNAAFGVDHFGSLTAMGFFAQYLSDAATLHDWTPEIAGLSDATDAETLDTMAWLALLGRDPSAAARVAFIAGDADEDELDPRDGSWTVPVVANTARAGVIVSLRCDGDLLYQSDRVRGVRAHRTRHVGLQVTARLPKVTGWPEMLISEDGLAIALTRHGQRVITSVGDWWPGHLEFDDRN